MSVESKLKVKVKRDVEVSMHPFMDYFKGFEKVKAVRKIFGEKTEDVLNNLRVEFAGMRAYMGVSDDDGHLLVSAYYLKNGDLLDIYLDVIHELVHVKQFLQGKELFDSDFRYIERPTEVEAYHVAVEEAKRLGLNDEMICAYLRTEWMDEEDFVKLTQAMNVRYDCPKEKVQKEKHG